ncbi:MAG: hypothetical protein JO262_14495 [Solirubrobacterales bacterium]|nr:hypothetical protein [Solirubrobacterales bacterium]
MRLKRTAAGAAVLLSAAVAVTRAGPVHAAGTPPTAAPVSPDIIVNVGSAPFGRPVAPGFVGWSFEFPAVRHYTGSNPGAINPVLVQLIRNLSPGQSPVLRIGGNSTDATWFPAPHVKRTPGIHNTITPSWLATTKALAQQTGGRLILGLNLKLDSGVEMAAEAQAFRTGIGAQRIAAFEIGNEPELYTIAPWYYAGPGQKAVYPRGRGFNFAAYAREVTGFAKLLGSSPLAGPATGSQVWLSKLPKVFAAEPGLRMVTYHRYPLIRCFTNPGDPQYPSIVNLLAPVSSRALLQGAAPYIALAHRHGAVFRLDELNSVACKGQWGVSNAFASALWALDTLFSMVQAGVDGVNFHTLPQSAYRLFTTQDVNGRWVAGVNPEYYGLLMFTLAAPPGSRLLPVSTPKSPDVRAWATRSSTGVVHVVLINDSATTAHVVGVPAPGSASAGLLESLIAPDLSATSGVTLAGQSFAAETSTGELEGPQQVLQLTPAEGQYLVSLAPASAAMLTLAPPS